MRRFAPSFPYCDDRFSAFRQVFRHQQKRFPSLLHFSLALCDSATTTTTHIRIYNYVYREYRESSNMPGIHLALTSSWPFINASMYCAMYFNFSTSLLTSRTRDFFFGLNFYRCSPRSTKRLGYIKTLFLVILVPPRCVSLLRDISFAFLWYATTICYTYP